MPKNAARGPSGRKASRRATGKTKKKSVKSRAILGSKRKLARFGKEQKKGHKGISTHYISRSRAINNLQLSLNDFRRLCILKGIYPRDPEGLKKPNGKHQSFYHVKDISFLAHEPLLQKFREFKTFAKKFTRLAGKRNEHDAEQLYENRPKYTLTHLVKERYPHFNNALHDMDDILCLLYLFAAMPRKRLIAASETSTSERLCREWEKYVTLTGTLQKCFVSVKGTYYQAVVHGEKVTWLVPHRFTQYIPKDVDFRMMSTFLEFYTAAFKFIMFKLFHELGMRYPPQIDERLLDAGAHLTAIDLEKIDDKKNGNKNNNEKDSDDEKESEQQVASKARIASLPAHLMSKNVNEDEDEEEQEENNKNQAEEKVDISPEFQNSEEFKLIQKEQTKREMSSKLFSNLAFFVSREVPRESLELCITSFGGIMGWDGEGSPFKENDRRITHHIVDRPKVQKKYTDREYLQPQWVYDSINAQMQLPVKRYVSGATLPPHLSPFVNDHEEGYIPAYREELDALKSAQEEREEAKRLEEDHEEDSEDERLEEVSYSEGLKAEASGVSFAKFSKGQQKNNKKRKKMDGSSSSSESDSDDSDSESDSDSDDSDEEDKRKDEEISQAALDRASRKRKKEEAFKKEEKERAIKVMPKKAKRLYNRMQHGIAKKREKVEKLERKRQKLAQEDGSGEKQSKKSKKKKKKKN